MLVRPREEPNDEEGLSQNGETEEGLQQQEIEKESDGEEKEDEDDVGSTADVGAKFKVQQSWERVRKQFRHIRERKKCKKSLGNLKPNKKNQSTDTQGEQKQTFDTTEEKDNARRKSKRSSTTNTNKHDEKKHYTEAGRGGSRY